MSGGFNFPAICFLAAVLSFGTMTGAAQAASGGGVDVKPIDPPSDLKQDRRSERLDAPRGASRARSQERLIVPGETTWLDPSALGAPIVSIPPAYPAALARLGVTGFCDIVFDVSPLGRPTNIQAAHCTHPAFAQAAVRAIEAWRYPRLVNGGGGRWVRGKQLRLEFDLGG